ncbi:hypothetical protein BS47DRAFT_371363 [Hydnum rufescens UP504]|uniref:Uncharacterized protein n=1 Tax=Hydnum rufescens UP504 TaxID=1448309 RepID=A0A9P6B622_9AGAM|nr:hypothetical protein BS47DRAFT_371363 [Hydnum rufescens UP504]
MRDTSMDDELVDIEPEPMTQPAKKKRRTKEINVPKSVGALESNPDSNARSGSPQDSGEIGMSTASNNEGLIPVHSDELAKPLKRKLKKKSEARDSTSKSIVIDHENNPEGGAPPSVIDDSGNWERSGSSTKKLKSKSKLRKSQESLPTSSPDSPKLLDHTGGDASSSFHGRPGQSPELRNLSAVPDALNIDDPINPDVAEDLSGNWAGENGSRILSEKQKQTIQAKIPLDNPRLSRSKSRATLQGEALASIADRIPTPALQLDPSDTEPRSPHVVLPQGRRSDVSIESPESSEDEDSARHKVEDEGVGNHGSLRISPPGAVDLAALLRPKKPRRAALVIPSDDENAKFGIDEDSGSELARSTPSDVEKLRDRKRRKSSRVSLDLHPLSGRHSSSTSEDFESPGESVIASGSEESIHDLATEDALPDPSSGESEMKSNGHEVEAIIDPVLSPIHHGAQDARISVPQALVRQAESSFVQLASVPDSQISQDGGDDAFAEALDGDEQAEQVALASLNVVQGEIGDRRISRDVVDFIDLDVETQTSDQGPSQRRPETVKSIGSSHESTKTSSAPQTPKRSLSPIQPASPWSQPDPDPLPPLSPLEATTPPSPKPSAQALNVSKPQRGIVEVVVPPRSPSRSLVPASQPSASVPAKRGPGRPRLGPEEKARRKEGRKLLKQPLKTPRKKTAVNRSKSEVLEASDSKVEKVAALARGSRREGSRQTVAPAHPLSTWTVLQPSTPSSPFPPSVESQAVDELHSSSPSMLSPRLNASFSQIDELISEFVPSPKHDLPEEETAFEQGASSPRIPKQANRRSNGLLSKTMRAMSNATSRDEGNVELSLTASTPSPAVSPQEEILAVDVVPSSARATGPKAGVSKRRESLPSAKLPHPDGSAIPLHLGVSSRKSSRTSLPSLRDLTIDTVRSAQPSSKPSTPGPRVSSQVLRRLTLHGNEEEEEEEETDDDDSDDDPAPVSQIPENRRAGAGIVQRAVRSLGATFFSA